LDNYTVKLYPRAYQDLDEIYSYIADHLTEPAVAEKITDTLEQAILSLEQLPERGSRRQIGIYAAGDYRQLFVKNYVIIYRVLPRQKEVHIITVRYAPADF
jgi:addiction module RelE/StbE family toxin